MRLRNILLALGAIFVLAGIALLIAWVGQRGAPRVEAEKPEAAKVSLLAAARKIPTGTLLRREDLAWKDVGPQEVRPGVLQRGQATEAEFVGSVNRRELNEGEPVIASELIKPADRRFLAAVLRPGMRAVSIAVDAPQSVSGLILPDDRVDILLIQTFSDDVTNQGRKTVGETVLRDVRVIAVDQSLNPQPETVGAARSALSAEARIPRTVTLELSEREAEMLMVAAQLGRIQLSMRPLEGSGVARENETGTPAPMWASDVSRALDEIATGARHISSPQPGPTLGPRSCASENSITGSTLECLIRRPPARLARGQTTLPIVSAPATPERETQ